MTTNQTRPLAHAVDNYATLASIPKRQPTRRHRPVAWTNLLAWYAVNPQGERQTFASLADALRYAEVADPATLRRAPYRDGGCARNLPEHNDMTVLAIH